MNLQPIKKYNERVEQNPTAENYMYRATYNFLDNQVKKSIEDIEKAIELDLLTVLIFIEQGRKRFNKGIMSDYFNQIERIISLKYDL